MKVLTRRCLTTVLSVVLAAGYATWSHAQSNGNEELPPISDVFLDQTRNLEGDRIVFCIYPEAGTYEFDRRVAELIGEALLIDVEFYEVQPKIAVDGLDGIPIAFEDLFILLTNECDAFLGIELAPDVYPVWVTISRPYIRLPYVAVVRQDTYGALSDIPPNLPIATLLMSAGDSYLGRYQRTLPETQTWRRFPYTTTFLAVERLLDGTVEAAIIWQAWLQERHIDPDEIDVVSTAPLTLPVREMGILLRSRDEYTRSVIDTAIADLEARGELAALFAEVYPSADLY